MPHEEVQQSSGGSDILLLGTILRGRVGERFLINLEKTHTNENSILFPSNRLYLKYFSNILDGFKVL